MKRGGVDNEDDINDNDDDDGDYAVGGCLVSVEDWRIFKHFL